MKRIYCILVLFSFCFGGRAAAAEHPLFGPSKYDVKERYGKENRYRETINVPEGLYLLKVQNGVSAAERPDLLSISLNGETLLKEQTCDYRYLAIFVKLQKENTLELVMKDHTPSGFRRPPATPKNVLVTVLPAPIKLSTAVLGLLSWEDLDTYDGVLQKIKSPESRAAALGAAGLQNDPAVRVEFIRQLAERKDPAARDLLIHLYIDFAEVPVVSAEAARALGALGDKTLVPLLMRGLLAPEESIRTASAQALARYPEEDTQELLAKTLERMDSIMRAAIVRAAVQAGWKPLGVLMKLTASPDRAVANGAIEMLSGSGDDRVVDLLSSYLESPGKHSIRLVITVLGESKNARAIEPLSRLAQDPTKRQGLEVELGTALAALGDQKSADLIVDMIKNTKSPEVQSRLIEAYAKLTGKEYK